MFKQQVVGLMGCGPAYSAARLAFFGGSGVVATLLILLRGKCFTCLGIAQKLPSRRCNPLKTPSFLQGETRVGTGIWTPGF